MGPRPVDIAFGLDERRDARGRLRGARGDRPRGRDDRRCRRPRWLGQQPGAIRMARQLDDACRSLARGPARRAGPRATRGCTRPSTCASVPARRVGTRRTSGASSTRRPWTASWSIRARPRASPGRGGSSRWPPPRQGLERPFMVERLTRLLAAHGRGRPEHPHLRAEARAVADAARARQDADRASGWLGAPARRARARVEVDEDGRRDTGSASPT